MRVFSLASHRPAERVRALLCWHVPAVLAFAMLAVVAPRAAVAAWMPPGIIAVPDGHADGCAAIAAASNAGSVLGRRRERWTYTVGTQRISVDVAVRDDDFRTSLALDGLTCLAGRSAGARWRADDNGVVHGVAGDLQGDAADRAPQAVFAIDPASCMLVGQTLGPEPAWVVELQRRSDKTAFLYVDATSGAIVREVMRDGKQVVTTAFDRFTAFGDGLRARHWRVDDGARADAIAVSIDAVEPAALTTADVAVPSSRGFGDVAVPQRTIDVPASFRHGEITLSVGIAGRHRNFVLDTGTTSITLDPAAAKSFGGATLEHCVLPQLTIGSLRADRVSVLTVPFYTTGILGLDFFFGHVVEIDYVHERVRILDAADAQRVFAEPQTTIVDANVEQGLPLVRAAFGPLAGDAFALDTGSPRLYVMRPFVARFAAQIAALWTKAGSPFVERYLEGGIEVQPYRAGNLTFAGAAGSGLAVGAQIPTKRTNDLDIPFDGIIGTNILANFDLFFDYDRARIGVRR